MRTNLMIATAAAAAFLAGSAFAQAVSDTGSATGDVGNPAASSTALPDTAANANAAPAASTPSDTTVAPAAGAPTERAPSASLDSNTDVVSNGPVPDTRANRAKYGQPMSNGGRMTKPAGN